MAARVTHAHFERYAQAKLEFVRNVAALAELRDDLKSRKATIEALLARVSDADVAALRAERDRLLLLLLQQQQLGSR